MKTEAQKFFPVYSAGFLRALIIHMRPYLLFVSAAAGLSGMAIGWNDSQTVMRFILLFISFFLGYGFGQALTDCYQTDTDAISAPYRPLVKNEILAGDLKIVSFTGLILIGIPVIWFNPWNVLFCVLTITGLATYTYFKKNFSLAGPFYNGWIVMLLPVMGFLAANSRHPGALADIRLIVLCCITFFSYANFVLIGYLKDISADQKTGYHTFPVVYGWDKTVWLGDLFVILSIAPFFLFPIHGNSLPPVVFFVIASALALSGQLTAHFQKNKSENHSSFPIICTVISFVLWQTAVVLLFQPEWLLFMIAFLLAFFVILFLRPERNQI